MSRRTSTAVRQPLRLVVGSGSRNVSICAYEDQERNTRINIQTLLGFVYEQQGKYPEAIDAHPKTGMAEAVARVRQGAGRSEEQEKLRLEEERRELEKMLKDLESPPPKPPLGR